MTVLEMLRKPLDERLALTGTKNLTSFKLDNEEYKGYKSYSFFWELTYPSEPKRSQGGVVDLTSQAYFLTPHLKIDFSLMSYDDYMRLRQQQLSKTYFQLSCWDTDFHQQLEREVYFHPATLPNFTTMARALNGEKWTEIIGAKNFVVELVGTNRNVAANYIIYYLNKPSSVSWGGETHVTDIYRTNQSVTIGANAKFKNSSGTATAITSIKFTGYTFNGWNTQPDGSGKSYTNGVTQTLLSKNPILLYAKWS